MMRCGLLGEKLGHSYSPAIHAELADYAYKLYEVAPDALRPLTVLVSPETSYVRLLTICV